MKRKIYWMMTFSSSFTPEKNSMIFAVTTTATSIFLLSVTV
ncbi:hypothetical protein [uncultured Sunxiuqinia sp.]|nr:hypothetical protein [uncultured Sunxiuqinia sp.]